MRKKHWLFILYISFLTVGSGCMEGGTHGSIKSYQYDVTKNALQNAVNKVIGLNWKIKKSPVTDSFTSKYYNDGDRYVSILITEDEVIDYVLQYVGTKEYWDTSRSSEISIAYAYDSMGNGGSEGNNGIKWYNWRLKNRLIKPFEKELILKVDSVLNTKHNVND